MSPIAGKTQKRKSVSAVDKKPAKVAKGADGSPKIEKEADSAPKVAKGPVKQKNFVSLKNVDAKKKQPKVKAPKVEKTEKLQKFKGTESLEKGAQKTKAKKEGRIKKRDYLTIKIQEAAKTRGRDAVIAELNEKIKAVTSRTELTKTGKRKIHLYKNLIKNVLKGEPIDVKLGSVSKPTQKLLEKNSKKTKQVKAEKKPEVAKVQIKKEQAPKGNKEKQAEAKKVEGKKGKKGKKIEEVKIEVEEDLEDESEEEDDVQTPAENDVAESSDDSEGDEDDDDDEDEDDEEDDDDDEDTDKEDEEEEKKTETKVQLQNGKPAKAQEKPAVKAEVGKGNLNKSLGQSSNKYSIFIGNLDFKTTKADLEQYFENTVDVRVPLDRETNKPRGFAFIDFGDEESQKKALELNDTELNGRNINVREFVEGNKSPDKRKSFQNNRNSFQNNRNSFSPRNGGGQFRNNNRQSFKGNRRQ